MSSEGLDKVRSGEYLCHPQGTVQGMGLCLKTNKQNFISDFDVLVKNSCLRGICGLSDYSLAPDSILLLDHSDLLVLQQQPGVWME